MTPADERRLRDVSEAIARAARAIDDTGGLLGTLIGAAYGLLRHRFGFGPEEALDKLDELAEAIRRKADK